MQKVERSTWSQVTPRQVLSKQMAFKRASPGVEAGAPAGSVGRGLRSASSQGASSQHELRRVASASGRVASAFVASVCVASRRVVASVPASVTASSPRSTLPSGLENAGRAAAANRVLRIARRFSGSNVPGIGSVGGVRASVASDPSALRSSRLRHEELRQSASGVASVASSVSVISKRLH